MLSQRFWAKVEPTGFCWNWIGYKDRLGYGRFNRTGAPELTHRLAYTELVGEIPDGLVLDHLCRNTSCVNPDHLDPVTNAVNVKRSPRHPMHVTQCPKGHEYTEENTAYHTTGFRYCKECNRIRGRKKRG